MQAQSYSAAQCAAVLLAARQDHDAIGLQRELRRLDAARDAVRDGFEAERLELLAGIASALLDGTVFPDDYDRLLQHTATAAPFAGFRAVPIQQVLQ